MDNKEKLMKQLTQNKVTKITDILLDKGNDMTNKKYKNLYVEFRNQLLDSDKKKQHVDSLYLIKLMNISYQSILKNCKKLNSPDLDELKKINKELKITLKNNKPNLDESKCSNAKGKDSIKLYKLCFEYLFSGNKNDSRKGIEDILKKKSGSLMNQKYKREYAKFSGNNGNTDLFYLSLMGIARESAIRNCKSSNINLEFFKFMMRVQLPEVSEDYFERLKNKCKSKKGKQSVELYGLCYNFLKDENHRLYDRNYFTEEERQKYENNVIAGKLEQKLKTIIDEYFDYEGDTAVLVLVHDIITEVKKNLNEETITFIENTLKILNENNPELSEEQKAKLVLLSLKKGKEPNNKMINDVIHIRQRREENKRKMRNIKEQEEVSNFFNELERLHKKDNKTILNYLNDFMEKLIRDRSSQIFDFITTLTGKDWIRKPVKQRIYRLFYDKFKNMKELIVQIISHKIKSYNSKKALVTGLVKKSKKSKYQDILLKLEGVNPNNYDDMISVLGKFIELLQTSSENAKEERLRMAESFLAALKTLSFIKTINFGRNLNNNEPVANNSGPVANNSGPVANNSGPVANNSGPVANNSGPVTNNSGPVANNSKIKSCELEIRNIIKKLRSKVGKTWTFKSKSRKRKKEYKRIYKKLEEIRDKIRNNSTFKCRSKDLQTRLLDELLKAFGGSKHENNQEEIVGLVARASACLQRLNC